MARKRTRYSPEYKFQVVMELLSWRMTQAEITSKYWIHASQQIKWKKQLMENGSKLFEDKRLKETKEQDAEKREAALYQQIGQLTMERDWLQKKIGWIPGLRF